MVMTMLQDQADDNDDTNYYITGNEGYKYSATVMTLMITIKVMVRIMIKTVMQLYTVTVVLAQLTLHTTSPHQAVS